MRHRNLLLFLATALGSALPACSPAAPRAVSAVAGLPEYTPEEATVFADLLTSAVFGLPREVPAKHDSVLALCAARADGIVLVRIGTISEETLAGTRGYSLSLSVDPTPMSGSSLESPLELQIGQGNPSLARVQASSATLVGKRFILLFKRYADAGEPKLHWRGEPDDPAVRHAIENAKALDAASSKPQAAP
jgi:hypothetical protein